MSESLIKLLLQGGIRALGAIIPALGSFLGGPFGFLASMAINFLTGILYSMVERLSRYAGVDARILAVVAEAKVTTAALEAVERDPQATQEQKDKAYEDFKASHRKFKFGGVQQG